MFDPFGPKQTNANYIKVAATARSIGAVPGGGDRQDIEGSFPIFSKAEAIPLNQVTVLLILYIDPIQQRNCTDK